MNPWIVLLAAVIGYLLGSLSFARIIFHLVRPDEEITGMEFEIEGSDEKIEVSAVSGTAVSVKLGGKWGGLTALLDILKALLPTLAFRFLYPGVPYHLFAATTALVGHNWPLYYRFKGGRGLSPMIGGFLAVDWLGTLVTNIVGMVFSLAVLKNIALSYMLGTLLMIPWLWFSRQTYGAPRTPFAGWTLYHVLYAVLVNAIFMLSMIPEFRASADRKRRGIELDPARAMEMTPMGHGIKKMANMVGLFKEAEEQDA
jgi:glycerol-3-phosphate acyltransferase PlsY